MSETSEPKWWTWVSRIPPRLFRLACLMVILVGIASGLIWHPHGPKIPPHVKCPVTAAEVQKATGMQNVQVTPSSDDTCTISTGSSVIIFITWQSDPHGTMYGQALSVGDSSQFPYGAYTYAEAPRGNGYYFDAGGVLYSVARADADASSTSMFEVAKVIMGDK